MSGPGPWETTLGITGVGLVTPVGLTAPSSAAALRAAISRLGELGDYEIEEPDGEVFTPVGARVPIVTEGYRGPERMLHFARLALDEALADAGCADGSVDVHLFLGLAEPSHAGRVLDHGEWIAEGLRRRAERSAASATVEVLAHGRAAALEAIRLAADAADREGVIAVAGGVDCWSDPLGLSDLHERGRLKYGEMPSGILPGEAAGFVVIESLEGAAEGGASVHATLAAAAAAEEPVEEDKPSTAAALTEVLRAVGSLVTVPTPLVVSDLNGERARALEWTMCLPRGVFPYEGDLRHWTPADCIGDTGAASGAVTAGWAALALARGYGHERQAIVWGGSDGGMREALLLLAPGEDG